MNVKAVIMLCLIFFAFASTITTIAMAINVLTPNSSSATETAFITHDIECGEVEPTGDPIDNPVFGS